MLRLTLAAMLLLTPAVSFAQTNTSGTISPNTTLAQGTTRPTTTGTVTPGMTNGTTRTTPGVTAPGVTTPVEPGGGTTAGAVPGTPRDAAIIVCGEDISTGANRLVVFNSSTSAGGPTIPPAAPCAQALADLFGAGFGIIDVQPVNQQLQYTLVR